MSPRALVAILAALGIVLTARPARADMVTVAFPSASSAVVDSGVNDSSQAAYFWSAARGDSITETFSNTGLTSVGKLDLGVNVTQNFLSAGAQVAWNVLLNGTVVGSWAWSDTSGTGPLFQSYTFAPITGGGTYTLRMEVTNEVPAGDGSIALGLPGSVTLTGESGISQVPEPSSLALLGGGALLLGGALRRRRR